MSATTATLAGRRAAEALMVDACTITRASGSPSTNTTTGVVTDTPTTVYAGKCRVQQVAPISKPGDVAEAAVWLQRLALQLPASVAGLATDDKVTITASQLDPDLVGRVFHVRELGHKTHVTARRVQIEEVTS